MKTQSLLTALTVVNCALLIYSLVPRTVAADTVAPVLKGRALQIVDEQGKVRASISVLPADPKVKMPDGTTGYPETVLMRLINSKGRPNLKLEAREDGSSIGMGGDTDPTYIFLQAKGDKTFIQQTNHDGKQQMLKP